MDMKAASFSPIGAEVSMRDSIRLIAAALGDAPVVVLVLGVEALRTNATPSILELRDALEAGLATEVEVKGMDGQCDERSRWSLGCIGPFGNSETRAYFAGMREGIVLSLGATIPVSARTGVQTIFVSGCADAIAYQPQTTVAIRGCIRLFVETLTEELRRVHRVNAPARRRTFWRPFEFQRRAKEGIDGAAGMNPIQIANALNDLCDDAFVAIDPGTAHMVFAADFEARRHSMTFSLKAGAVGLTAIPTALASAVFDPWRPSIAITGDGSWMAGSSAEIHTAACYNIGFVTVILDNNGEQICRVGDMLQRGRPQFPSNYEVAIELEFDARAKGAIAKVARDDRELRAALCDALGTPVRRPIVIVAKVNPDFEHYNLITHIENHHRAAQRLKAPSSTAGKIPTAALVLEESERAS